MRRILLIVGVVVLVLLVVVGGLLYYAATNLNSIIAQNRGYLLTKVSDSLGRRVEVSAITVKIGWGVAADLQQVRIADDPSISKQPFVKARDVYADLEFLPLLSRQLHVTRIVLDRPEVRIVRTTAGKLNIATLGKKAGNPKDPPTQSAPVREKPANPLVGAPVTAARPETRAAPGPSMLAGLFVRSFEINRGEVIYEDRMTREPPVRLSNVDLAIRDFGLDRPFRVKLALAAFGQKQNLELAGVVGPLGEGRIEPTKVPVQLRATVGPVLLTDLRKSGSIGTKIPEKLVLPDPVKLEASAKGSLDALGFSASTDLGAGRVGWGDLFSKPAGVPFKIALNGSRQGAKLRIAKATVTIGTLDLKATQIRFGEGATSARIDTNRFALGPVAKLMPSLAGKYGPAGDAEIHADVRLEDGKPLAKGTVSLAKVSLTRAGESKPLVSGVTGDIKLDGNSAAAGPLAFVLGSSSASATVRASSIQPLNATYNLKADSVRLADIAPKRPADERVNKLAVAGTVASGRDGVLSATAKATSSDGLLQNIDYRSLDLSAAFAGKRLDLKSLKVDAFGGHIAASGEATLASKPEFALNLSANRVDLQKLLESQKSKAADMVRGILVGQVKLSGAGAKFDDIKPTLDGSGSAKVADGKLVGVNVAAKALGKIENLPAIGNLVPASVVQRHPELFKNPDTDIRNLSLTFTLKGPRITSHDLLLQTQDYELRGDGWFDMDKKIDLLAHVLLTKQLSDEIIAEKKNVVYLTNPKGEVDIPLEVRGTLPKPAVLPDVTDLAQRAGRRAVEQKGRKTIEQFLEKKGLGGILGGPSRGAAAPSTKGGTPAPTPKASPSPNPLEKLRKLF